RLAGYQVRGEPGHAGPRFAAPEQMPVMPGQGSESGQELSTVIDLDRRRQARRARSGISAGSTPASTAMISAATNAAALSITTCRPRARTASNAAPEITSTKRNLLRSG